MPQTASRLSVFTRKRDILLGYLERIGLTRTEPQGASYVMVDISSLGFEDDAAAAEAILRQVGVAGVPGSSLFREPANRFPRLHFAKREDTPCTRPGNAFSGSGK